MANLRLHTLNDVKMIGRLTRDPELRYTPQGTPVCHFRVAVSLPGLEPAEGVGGNKRAAEKNAALAMLAREVGGKYEG